MDRREEEEERRTWRWSQTNQSFPPPESSSTQPLFVHLCYVFFSYVCPGGTGREPVPRTPSRMYDRVRANLVRQIRGP